MAEEEQRLLLWVVHAFLQPLIRRFSFCLHLLYRLQSRFDPLQISFVDGQQRRQRAVLSNRRLGSADLGSGIGLGFRGTPSFYRRGFTKLVGEGRIAAGVEQAVGSL
jgi:hypothetical protein